MRAAAGPSERFPRKDDIDSLVEFVVGRLKQLPGRHELASTLGAALHKVPAWAKVLEHWGLKKIVDSHPDKLQWVALQPTSYFSLPSAAARIELVARDDDDHEVMLAALTGSFSAQAALSEDKNDCMICAESVLGCEALRCSQCSSNPFHKSCVTGSRYSSTCPQCSQDTVVPWKAVTANVGQKQSADPNFYVSGLLHPHRPNMPACNFYLKTGSCKYGQNCKWDHPRQKAAQAAPKAVGVVKADRDRKVVAVGANAPAVQRPGKATFCRKYVQTGKCKFGDSCWYDHPVDDQHPAKWASPLKNPPAATQSVPQGVGFGIQDGRNSHEDSSRGASAGHCDGGLPRLPGKLEDWSAQTVSDFVRGLTEDLGDKTEEYANVMKQEHVSGRVLLGLREEDLKELGFSLGHRKLLLAQVARLRNVHGI